MIDKRVEKGTVISLNKRRAFNFCYERFKKIEETEISKGEKGPCCFARSGTATARARGRPRRSCSPRLGRSTLPPAPDPRAARARAARARRQSQGRRPTPLPAPHQPRARGSTGRAGHGDGHGAGHGAGQRAGHGAGQRAGRGTAPGAWDGARPQGTRPRGRSRRARVGSWTLAAAAGYEERTLQEVRTAMRGEKKINSEK